MPTLYEAQTPSSLRLASVRGFSRTKVFEWLLLLCTITLIEICALGQSAMKFFWYDELVTLRIAQLGSVHSIFQFFQAGKDTTGLLPAMIVHAMAYLPGRPEVITRLPFEFGYLLTCLCVYRFLRFRYPAGYALSGTLTLALGYSFYYATEIRSYSFLLLGSALACVAWQSLNERRSSGVLAALGLWLGLSIAIMFHVFAGFLFIPFAIAQVVSDRASGRALWSAWAALLLFPLSLAPLVPSILAARQIYGKTFWAPPTLRSVMEVYGYFADTPARIFPALLILLAIYLWHIREGRQEPADGAMSAGFSLAEWVLLFALGLFPVICFLGSLPLGVYRAQYVMPFFFGISILTIGLVAEFTHRSRHIGLVLAGSLALLFCGQQKIRLGQGLVCLLGKPATVTLPTEYSTKWYIGRHCPKWVALLVP